jgi:hypothetical protein
MSLSTPAIRGDHLHLDAFYFVVDLRFYGLVTQLKFETDLPFALLSALLGGFESWTEIPCFVI